MMYLMGAEIDYIDSLRAGISHRKPQRSAVACLAAALSPAAGELAPREH